MFGLEISGLQIGLVSVGLMVLLIYAGMHVGVALTLLSFIGVWMIKGNVVMASKLLALAAADSIFRYVFGVIPLFVLMGFLVSSADLGRDLFDVANWALRKIRGGLGLATVAANAGFAAITGISIASAAVFTRVAVPEMIRLGYQPRFAIGVVAGSSVLGMLIPPSLLLILYGILTETSIGDLFIAAIIPGIILSLAFCGLILFMASRFPGYVMAETVERDDHALPAMTLWTVLAKTLPLIVLAGLVLGGIYGGLFTPTEAGGVGAFAALVIVIAMRRLTWKQFLQVLVQTGHVTASVCFLLISASMYSRMLALSRIPEFCGDWIHTAQLGFYPLLTIYLIVILLMGTILDSSSIFLITIPLILPIMKGFNVDLVWLGVVTTIAVEVGLLTPPLGLSAYVIHDTLADDRVSLNDVFAGAFPFAVIMVLVVILLVLVLQILMFLI